MLGNKVAFEKIQAKRCFWCK